MSEPETKTSSMLSVVSPRQTSDASKATRSGQSPETASSTLLSIFGWTRHKRPGLKERDQASIAAWTTAKSVYKQVKKRSLQSTSDASFTKQDAEEIRLTALSLAAAEVSRLEKDHKQNASNLIAEGGSLRHLWSSVAVGCKSGWYREDSSRHVQEKVEWYIDEAKRQVRSKQEKGYEKATLDGGESTVETAASLAGK